ncbi:hypothetical protein VTH06DRAFT_6872 [Thermothelomyces fergusii]
MMMQTQRAWLAWAACLLRLAGSATALPVEGGTVARRDVTVTTTKTVTAAPTTVTVNPLDRTVTRDAGWTTTVGPPAFTSTITSDCITYSYSYPPSSEATTVVTTTVTERSTVTVTDTKLPPQTHTTWYVPTVTATKPTATYISYHCTNTMVVQYADWEYLTWTWTHWRNVATTTGLCLTTSTRSTTLPGLETLLPTVYTTVYTTVTVVTNSVYTLTGTAVVDVNTQVFSVTRITYTTTATGWATVTQTGSISQQYGVYKKKEK